MDGVWHCDTAAALILPDLRCDWCVALIEWTGFVTNPPVWLCWASAGTMGAHLGERPLRATINHTQKCLAGRVSSVPAI